MTLKKSLRFSRVGKDLLRAGPNLDPRGVRNIQNNTSSTVTPYLDSG